MDRFTRKELRFLFNTKSVQTSIFGIGFGTIRSGRSVNNPNAYIVSDKIVILSEELHTRWLSRLAHQRALSSSGRYHLNTSTNKEITKAMELLIREYPKYNENEMREFLKLAELNSQKKPKYKNYNQMPKGVTKDNSDGINFKNGGSNSSSIRYPKKNRKTAWKRFYKLFPHLKDKNNE